MPISITELFSEKHKKGMHSFWGFTMPNWETELLSMEQIEFNRGGTGVLQTLFQSWLLFKISSRLWSLLSNITFFYKTFLCPRARVRPGVNFGLKFQQVWVCFLPSCKKQPTRFIKITPKDSKSYLVTSHQLYKSPLSVLELEVSWILYVRDCYKERLKDRAKTTQVKIFLVCISV